MFTVNNKNWHVLCAQVNAPKSGAINCCGWVAGARTCFYFIEHHSEIWKTHQLISCFLYSLQAMCKVAFFFPSPISCAWSGGRGMARTILKGCTLWEKVTRTASEQLLILWGSHWYLQHGFRSPEAGGCSSLCIPSPGSPLLPEHCAVLSDCLQCFYCCCGSAEQPSREQSSLKQSVSSSGL